MTGAARAVIALLVLGVAWSLPTDVRADPQLPSGGPPALHSELPDLPEPSGWPFGGVAPRTSGTGRYAGGAHVWTDFLYDDHGAVGGVPRNESVGAVSFGSYTYPEPEQAGNGADLFRVGVGLDRRRTWWRIDWNTLVDPSVPIAAFVMDADADPTTGVAAWPAGANVSSPGIERALIVAGTGAWLLDLESGTRSAVEELGGTHDVDPDARSFVVSVPRADLPVSGTWTLRVGAGLADADGDGFLQLTPEHGAVPGGASLYNVAYRGYDHEPVEHNFWFDRSQAEALSARDVSPFALQLDWTALEDGRTDPEPSPDGWSNRWYVSSIELGQGRVQGEASTSDGEPNYLGRVQPYGVWVPSELDRPHPPPLTWILHSFTINHNQYAATAPDTVRALCEDRRSVCVTPLGRGPDGQYRSVAELDLWEVWRDLADHVPLDPDRTVIGGYSMGGFGTWRIAAMHPDLFAGMFLLSSAARDDLPLATNLRTIPYYHDHGALDELVPIAQARETIARLDELGHRYVFDVHPAEDHVAYSLKDGWRQLVEWVDEEDRTVTRRPARIDYTWFPADVDEELGIGPDGAWWLSDLEARDDIDRPPQVRARSHAIAEPEHEVVRTRSVLADAEPSPAVRERLDWNVGEPARTAPSISLELTGVASLQIDVDDADLDTAAPGAEVTVASDDATVLALAGVPDGTVVLLDGERVGAAPAAATLDVPEGDHTITFSAPGSGDRPRAGASELPATGGGAGAALVLIGVGVLLRAGPSRYGSGGWV